MLSLTLRSEWVSSEILSTSSTGGTSVSARLSASVCSSECASCRFRFGGADRHHRRRWGRPSGSPVGERRSPGAGSPVPQSARCSSEWRVGPERVPEREAQGSNGQHSAGNGRAFATASSVEQRLEVAEGVGLRGISVPAVGDSGPTARRQGSWRHDAAAGEGKASKGMRRRGDSSQTSRGTSRPTSEDRNTANPMTGCRVQQTCEAR
jgi:hypothetical protein